MNRATLLLNGVLLAVLAHGAVGLVQTSYEVRRLFAEGDRAQRDHQRMELEQRRLDAEREAATTNQRVERTARERLSMRPASPGVTVYVPDPGPSHSAATAATPTPSGGRP